MKTLQTLFALIVFTIGASAQFIAGPNNGPALVTTSAFLLPGSGNGSGLTNPASAYQSLIPVGKNGVGFGLTLLSTNAASTTNLFIVLEGSADGTYWADNTTAKPVIVAPPGGAAAITFFTNMQPTAANLANIRYLRVKHITNADWRAFWITNFIWSIKE